MSLPRPLFGAEPPSLWHARPPVVVDCSAVAALLWSEPSGTEALTRIEGRRLHAPGLLPYELANVARSKCRSGVPPAAAQDGLGTFDDLRITLHEVDAVALFQLATHYELTAYDAAYLWLAAELDAPLITFDRRLALAAQRHLDPRG
ncbi:MAG TPA: type II toxin-antitoxin system VapC family toxin [Rubrivivax sp.]|nr:type II toxin-antitoxin system VapC family toxin [Rubrivivax sp.]